VVEKRQPVHGLGLALRIVARRIVAEDFDGPDNGAAGISNGLHSHQDGHAAALLMAQEETGLVHIPVGNGCRQRATLMAQLAARVIDVAQNIVLAAFPHQLFRGVAGQPISPLVPILNPPLPVHKVHAVGHVIQQFLVEAWIARRYRTVELIGFHAVSHFLLEDSALFKVVSQKQCARQTPRRGRTVAAGPHGPAMQLPSLSQPSSIPPSPARLNGLNAMTDTSQFIIPRGFRFAAAKAGLKQSGRTDFALIVADRPASAAAVYTANRVTAAPLIVDKEHLRASGGKVRVAAINAGNANCAAGQPGLDAARATCAAAAHIFGCRAEEVFPSSTGIIGVPLPAQKLIAALPGLAASLGTESGHFLQVAQAILTTDTVEKTAFARLEAVSAAGKRREIRIAAVGKGSGMIHPQLVPHATMLVYVLTDAAVEPAVLDAYLQQAIEVSFNRISVDGDTSTNDTVLLLASGASGAVVGPHDASFAAALTQVCTSLARQIVADGEGASHVVELRIEGATTDADALKVAKAIEHSPLVKTAWAGSDPNWGRLAAAIGYSGAEIDPDRIDIWFGELPICRDGGRAPEFDEAAAHAYVSQHEFSITIQLHQGQGSCAFWTTDLTVEYIHINADYST
jgi:glutamate N-acetyltransferase/amino-acid N-acetyltransferase